MEHQTDLRIQLQLVVQNIVSSLIDLVHVLALVLLPRIHRAPLAIPHAQAPRVHPLALLLVAPHHTVSLRLRTRVRLGCVGEAVHRVVVDGECGIWPAHARIVWKAGEVGRVRVPVEEEYVVRVDGADRGVKAVVECDEAAVFRVRGFVQKVVPRDPLPRPERDGW